LIFRVRVGANGTTADNQAWINTTSAAQVANARAGFDGLLYVRAIGASGLVCAEAQAHAGALGLGTLVAAPTTAAVVTTANWFINVSATCSVGTYTILAATIDAL
jgi:hypothetical protein